MIDFIKKLWHQLSCNHEWKYHSFKDDYTNGKFREQTIIICKKCGVKRVWSDEDYDEK